MKTPWTAIEANPNLTRIINKRRETVCFLDHPYWDDKAEATAHLLSASPDLLEACEMALKGFQALEMQGQDTSIECDQLKAAINKAKGESE